MHISQFTDYSLRLLIMAAARAPQMVTVSEAADAYGISRNHLTKVAHELGKAGYLVTVRGRGGGLKLAIPPDSIRIGRLVRQCESGSVFVECFDAKTNRCVITPVCRLSHLLAHAESAFYADLDSHTLADLVGDRHALLSALGFSVPV